jgi:hypothetical protein
MKTETRKIITTEQGTELLKPEDGFIIEGNIWAAEVNEFGAPNSGFVGNNFVDRKVMDKGGDEYCLHVVGKLEAYSKYELLKVLGYTYSEMLRFTKQIGAEEEEG